VAPDTSPLTEEYFLALFTEPIGFDVEIAMQGFFHRIAPASCDDIRYSHSVADYHASRFGVAGTFHNMDSMAGADCHRRMRLGYAGDFRMEVEFHACPQSASTQSLSVQDTMA
jgi:hypothetical protein